jgi:hypothetical protein
LASKKVQMAGLLDLTFPAQYLALEAGELWMSDDLYERIGLGSPESFVRLCLSQSNQSTLGTFTNTGAPRGAVPDEFTRFRARRDRRAAASDVRRWARK